MSDSGRPNILVVGSMNMDMVVHGVSAIAGYGETVFCDGYEYVPGGKGANQAVAVSRLGGNSAMVGCLGADGYGDALVQNLNANGVDTINTLRNPATQTGTATMLVDKKTGKYHCYVVLGGNGLVNGGQVEAALARRRFDMVLMQLEMPLETVYRTYELAKAHGVPVFLDAGPAMNIPLERLRGIFVISPNEAETKALTGIEPDTPESAEQAAKALYEAVLPEYVLLKLGARGAMLYDGKTTELIPCRTDIPAVDSTGAGDTFSAAFAVRYCKGAPARQAILFAHAAAGLCVGRRGGQSAIPTLEEVRAHLAQKGGQ